MLIMMLIMIIVILKTNRMRVTRMQRGIPHVYRVGRLLKLWMRRRDPTKVLRACLDLFPRAKVAPRPLIVSQEKLETDQYCKLGRQEGFGLGISKPARSSPEEEEEERHLGTTSFCPQTTPFWQLCSSNVDFHHHYANLAASWKD